jgi:hypothetical protein
MSAQPQPDFGATPRIYFDPSYSQVPDAMKQANQWLAFRVTWNPETEHFDKTPLNSKGNVMNDHQGGESFPTMLEYVKRNPNIVLGFYVRPPFIAIDLDTCVKMETKDIAVWAQDAILGIGSYAELSPSGTGIHIIGLGTKPGSKSKIGSVEIYTDKRALTVTGCPIEGYENLNQVDVASVYDKMVSRAYTFGASKHERVLNERASTGEGSKIHHEGGAITNLLTLLATGDYTPDAKPFRVTDNYENWVEYPSQSEAIAAYLVCLARKHDCDPEQMEQEYLDSHLSDIPKWANGKWGRLGKDEIQSAIDLVRKPQQVTAKPAVKAEPVENIKSTSLFIVGTAPEAELATSLGYHALAASDFKPPLDPEFDRVALLGKSTDDRFSDVWFSIPNADIGAVYSGMPGKFGWKLTNAPRSEAAAFLEKLCGPLGTLAKMSVNSKRVKTVQVPAESRIEVRDNSGVAEMTDSEMVSEMPQSALASTRLGDIYADLFEPNDWPLDLALPALVTAASVLVPRFIDPPDSTIIRGDDNVVSLYTALISKIGAGKSQVTEWAAKSLNIFNLPTSEHYAESKWGSAEQMFRFIKGRQSKFKNAVLLNPDELAHLFAKAGIPNASFATNLTTAFYRRRQNITIAKGVELNFDLALSLIGGIVDEEFGTVMNSATIGGLYDRMLCGEAAPGFQWAHREYPRQLSNEPLDPLPIAVSSDGSVTEVERAWRKKDSGLGRIVEVCIRIAKIYASLDGRPVITGRDLEALQGLAMRQKTIRTLRQPNPGLVPDAIFSNAVEAWLKVHTKGEWVTVSALKEGVHGYEMKLGSGVAERALLSMSRGDRIDLWVPRDREGTDLPLPDGYYGRRPRRGLVRMHDTRAV